MRVVTDRTKTSLALCSLIGAGAAAIGLAPAAHAGVIAQCGQAVCYSSFSIFLDGASTEAGGGQLAYNAQSGNIWLDKNPENVREGTVEYDGDSFVGLVWDLGDDASVTVQNLWGNADPILHFAVATMTGATSQTVSFVFDLPIALTGPIHADAQVSYSLTSASAAGAEIKPVAPNATVVRGFEVDLDGLLEELDKGVGVGDPFAVSGGPSSPTSATYSAVNFFTGDLGYDLMRVRIDYELSAMSAVGLSGFVRQVVVPLPAALPLLLAGLAGFGAFARRRRPA